MRSHLRSLLHSLDSLPGWLTLGFVVLISYFTYFHNYAYPSELFWDENYHIASAQKYLNGTYFMEPHPPLAKMLIALGEKIVDANADDSQYIDTDYANNLPSDFSFRGYRLFPALFAWLTAPILYGVFFFLTRKHLWATLLSFFYVFDNGLIVHFRSAMLDSTLLFFVAAAILCFFLLLENRKDVKKWQWYSLLFGLCIGALAATKANGLIVGLLAPALLWIVWDWDQSWRFFGLSAIGFFSVFFGVWYLHFAIGSTVEPALSNSGYYEASSQYKEILNEGATASPANFPVMLRDSLRFLPHYERGVPRLDLCKSDENGSAFFMWPLGARSINYRWETPNGEVYRYLYLQVNPVVYGLSLLGVLLSGGLLLTWLFFPLQEKLKNPKLLLTFFGMYAAYMFVMSRIDRVMYLYHYFIPLLFSFVLFGLAVLEINRLGKWKQLNDTGRTILLLVCAVCIFAGYQFYRPLSYYEPIGDEAFKKRMIFNWWDLRCVNCERNNPLVSKTCS